MTRLRIGQGYDAHRLVEGRPLILGGVEIPYGRGLLGHSDADVLIHAVIDALFGAAALGDIGKAFPDTAASFKDISSLVLLEKTAQRLGSEGFCVVNIDATIVAQAPRIAPYIDVMRTNIARALGVCPEQINVKATTEEKMGFTGEGRGISAHAVALLERQLQQPVI